MTQVDDAVPVRLRPTLARLVAACSDDDRVRSAWLEGSFASGLEDEWSDIDLHLLVDEPNAFNAVEWLESITPLVLADSIPGLFGAFICLTPEWVHIDLVVHSRAAELAQDTPRRVLIDKDSLIGRDTARTSDVGSPYFPGRQVQIFLYSMGTAVASLHRGDLIAVSQTTAMMRDHLLVQLMLAENGIGNEAGPKRLTGRLNSEQMACLRGLPSLGVNEPSQREALEAIASAYLGRAHRLAGSCHADWPAELERATKRLWADELGIGL
ncbi:MULTISPECIES: aminoglycoside 6-adenylyltransferase [Arthrobacter]|nr:MULTISPECIES: nucleotidyltransferase domain-containing protein [Arthrobacter]MBT8163051.1 nucleotidyltransferase domain-containing protein [Arthrobacter sp. GN70]